MKNLAILVMVCILAACSPEIPAYNNSKQAVLTGFTLYSGYTVVHFKLKTNNKTVFVIYEWQQSRDNNRYAQYEKYTINFRDSVAISFSKNQ